MNKGILQTKHLSIVTFHFLYLNIIKLYDGIHNRKYNFLNYLRKNARLKNTSRSRNKKFNLMLIGLPLNCFLVD